MNSAHPIEDKAGAPGTGTTIVAPDSLPERTNTAIAEVLSRLLGGEAMTGLEAVFAASTTRLAAHVNYLESEYCWEFARREKVHACGDSRVVKTMTCRLKPAIIAAANTKGSTAWCASVRVARAALRRRAAPMPPTIPVSTHTGSHA